MICVQQYAQNGLSGASVLNNLFDKDDIVQSWVGNIVAIDFGITDPFEQEYETVYGPYCQKWIIKISVNKH